MKRKEVKLFMKTMLPPVLVILFVLSLVVGVINAMIAVIISLVVVVLLACWILYCIEHF